MCADHMLQSEADEEEGSDAVQDAESEEEDEDDYGNNYCESILSWLLQAYLTLAQSIMAKMMMREVVMMVSSPHLQ